MIRSARTRGQSLMILAVVLPVLLLMVLGLIEIGARAVQRAALEDALRAATRIATRSIVADMALRTPSSADGPPTEQRGLDEAITAHARAALAMNLRDVTLLSGSPEAIAARAHWSVLPDGGTCAAAGQSAAVSFSGPAMCGTLTPPMQELIMFGPWQPTIAAGVTLDVQP